MNLETAVLRANPRYELVLLDRLEPGERELVEGAVAGDALEAETAAGRRRSPAYGLLRPVSGSGLEPRVVSTDTALLFLTLVQPGPCPAFVRSAMGDRYADALGRLILDQVLEVERDGAFRSGGEAWEMRGIRDDRGGGRIADLSIQALRYGQELRGLPPEMLGLRLYLFGRRPITPELRRRLPDEDAVWAFLVGADHATAATLRRAWLEVPARGDGSPWRSWHPKRTRMPDERRLHDTIFKLYVSPAPDDLPSAIGAVAATLAGIAGTASFKVGRTVEGVTRPDKLVAYFPRQDDLLEAARRIGPFVAGLRPHGVPFTAAIAGDGMLSWGIDPPSKGSGAGRGSWRSWVTERLADYLAAARPRSAAGAPIEPWQIALERIRLDGVDTDTWVPGSGVVGS